MISTLTWDYLLHACSELFIAAALLIAATATLLSYRAASIYDKKLLRVLFATIAMLVSNAISWLLLPTPGNIWPLRFLTFLNYSFSVTGSIFFLEYVFCYTQKDRNVPKKIRRIMWAIGIAGIMFWLALLPTRLVYDISVSGEYPGPLYFITMLPNVLSTVINAITVIKNRENLGRAMLVSFLAYALYPLIIFIPLAFGRASLSEIGGALCVFFTYCIVHVGQSERNAAREIEMMQVRSRLSFNRLQPKLIFNALDSVYCLCDEDPQLAQSAVSDFADYLRININTMRLTEPVPFEMERTHTEKYISLVKLRYEERLRVVWDMQDEKSFRIPMLTLQPLVQNAIEHGINMRREGGTITISSRELSRYHEITVSDDGIGFDTKLAASDKRIQNPLGLRGIRSRLAALCNGQLRVQSKPGEGTVATILIPKEERRV